MDHVLGGDVHDDRTRLAVRVFNEGNVDFVKGDNIILGLGIVWIEGEMVGGINVSHVLPADFAVLAGIKDVPGELLGGDMKDGGFLGIGEFVHCFGPKRHGDSNQKDGFD
jgi:hypothetical protein